MTAIRRSLLAISVAPVWAITAILLLTIWPGWIAAGHLIVLAFFGAIVADVSLIGFQKIPFTCSYQPGKSKAPVVFAVFGGFLAVLAMVEGLMQENRALESPARYAVMIAILCAVAACARWMTVARANSPEAALLFEETEAQAIFALDLHKDGRWSG